MSYTVQVNQEFESDVVVTGLEDHDDRVIRVETPTLVVSVSPENEARIFDKATGNQISVVPNLDDDADPKDGFNILVGSGYNGPMVVRAGMVIADTQFFQVRYPGR